MKKREREKRSLFYILCLLLQVEVTRFEELEEVTAEVKLKQLMWDSRNEWETSYNEWMTVRERKRKREGEKEGKGEGLSQREGKRRERGEW